MELIDIMHATNHELSTWSNKDSHPIHDGKITSDTEDTGVNILCGSNVQITPTKTADWKEPWCFH